MLVASNKEDFKKSLFVDIILPASFLRCVLKLMRLSSPTFESVVFLVKLLFFREQTLPDCDGNDAPYVDFCNVDPSRLLLENVTRAFHGNYSCQGMNSAGWGPMSPPTQVIVHHKPNMTYIQYEPDIVIKVSPSYLTKLDNYGPDFLTTTKCIGNTPHRTGLRLLLK